MGLGDQFSDSKGEAIVDVALNARPRSDVAVVVGISDATEAVASPTSIVFTPHNWQMNQAISVRGVGDLLADGTVSYDVTFSAASADSAYARLPPARLSFENQDQAPIASPCNEGKGSRTKCPP
jgi:hypothetical protein